MSLNVFAFIIPLFVFHKIIIISLFVIFISFYYFFYFKKFLILDLKIFFNKNRLFLFLIFSLFLSFFFGLYNFNYGNKEIYIPTFLYTTNKLFVLFAFSYLFLNFLERIFTEEKSTKFMKYLFIGFIFAMPIIFIEWKTSFIIQRIFKFKTIGYYKLNVGIDCYAVLSFLFYLFFKNKSHKIMSYISILIGYSIVLLGMKFIKTSYTSLFFLIIATILEILQNILKNKTRILNRVLEFSLQFLFLSPFLFYFININWLFNNFRFLFKESLVHRIIIWHESSKLFFTKIPIINIIFGSGPYSYRFLTEKFPQIVHYNLDSFVYHPHNFALELLMEVGYFGYFIFGVLILKLFRNLKDSNHKILLISLLIIPSISHSIWSSWFLYFTVFTLAVYKISLKASDFTLKNEYR